jgi:small GTP-binding protein
MSKYAHFDNDATKKRSSKRREDDQFEILRMPQPYSVSSPYNKITDFNDKTKIVCQKTDLSLFLEQCKVLFVGDCEVGKTSLIKSFRACEFDSRYRATRGVDYENFDFEILNVSYNVNLWDVSGEENYKIINQPYYKNATAIVAVFDLTKPSSMINATRWMKEVLAANEKNDPLRFLVGTKSDLLPKKALQGLELHARFIAQEIDAEYFSTSSRDPSQVTNLFKRFTSLSFDKSVQKLLRPADYNIVKNNIRSE